MTATRSDLIDGRGIERSLLFDGLLYRRSGENLVEIGDRAQIGGARVDDDSADGERGEEGRGVGLAGGSLSLSLSLSLSRRPLVVHS